VEDAFAVHDLVGSPALTLDGSGGSNTLQGPNGANTWQVSGPNSGSLDGTVKFVSVQNLTGGFAGDAFQFQTGGSLSGKIDGGAGINNLDYSAFLGDVTVDLPLSIASAVAKGIFNIQNVTGSQGNDLIVGDANPNVLRGGTGRNIIIGGAGGDQIYGGGGDNLLIGGTTDYNGLANLPVLQAIMNEFMQSYDFGTRVTNIKKSKGTLAGTTYHLDASNVHADPLTDQIWGGGGANWFFAVDPKEIDGGKGPGANDAFTHLK
jgi:Ca2+-binding RTX toxin-like protein